MKLLIIYLLQSLVTSPILGPHLFLSTLVSGIFSLFSSRIVRDQIFHPVTLE